MLSIIKKPQFYTSLLHRLRYKHMLLLTLIYEHKNLNLAANHLAMSQPAATRMLQDVEQYLGCQLFKRVSRGMEPTVVGLEVIKFAQSTLGSLERCAENLIQWQSGGYGLLIVGAIMGAAPDLIAQTIAELKIKNPLLTIHLKGETSDQLIQLMSQGKVDFAIGRFSEPEQHNWLNFEPIGNEQLLLVVRSGHALTHKKQVNLLELTKHPWILQPISSPARQILEREFENANTSSPKNTVECDSIFASLQLIQRTDAVMMMPEPVLRDHLNTGLLTVLPISIGKSLPPYGILTHRNEPMSEVGQEFIKLLRRFSQLSLLK